MPGNTCTGTSFHPVTSYYPITLDPTNCGYMSVIENHTLICTKFTKCRSSRRGDIIQSIQFGIIRDFKMHCNIVVHIRASAIDQDVPKPLTSSRRIAAHINSMIHSIHFHPCWRHCLNLASTDIAPRQACTPGACRLAYTGRSILAIRGLTRSLLIGNIAGGIQGRPEDPGD